MTDSAGRNILATGVSVLGAGPALLRGGEVRINDVVNGFTADTSTERQPRTVAGIKEDGSLLLAVFDGRTSASAGVTLREVAMLLRELGAVDAMNLDGGGSSTMVVRDRLFNRPSDVGRSGTPCRGRSPTPSR